MRHGALGRTDSPTPPPRGYPGKPWRPINGTLHFSDLSVGDLHTCAIEAVTHHAYCWGANEFSQLGTGSPDHTAEQADATVHSQPMPVLGGMKFIQVAAGLDHTCALTDRGEVYCWGRALRGSLGHSPGSGVPIKVLGPD
jgi:alpha-tubulin suppressor-like RCC1 family protein